MHLFQLVSMTGGWRFARLVRNSIHSRLCAETANAV